MKVNTVVDGKGCANHEPVVGDRGRRLLDLIGLDSAARSLQEKASTPKAVLKPTLVVRSNRPRRRENQVEGTRQITPVPSEEWGLQPGQPLIEVTHN